MALSVCTSRPVEPRDVAQRATPELEGLVGIGITIRRAPARRSCSRATLQPLLPRADRRRAPVQRTADGRRQLIDFLVAGDCLASAAITLTASRRSRTPR